jgi:hypothetical protein
MYAYDYYQKYQRAQQGSTVATRRTTPQDIQAIRTDRGVDFHIEQATAKD